MRATVAFMAFLMLAAFPVAAQEPLMNVSITTTPPTVDGVVAAGEYGASLTVGNASVGVALSAGSLTIAVSARTQGWVAVGIGSGRMNGATILIGYVSDGKLQLKPQIGRGHGHSDIAFDSLLSSAGKEQGGWTTIEVSLKPGAFIAAEQKELSLIVAYGTRDSFVGMHAARWSATARLTK